MGASPHAQAGGTSLPATTPRVPRSPGSTDAPSGYMVSRPVRSTVRYICISRGLSLSTKDRCTVEESHGRISTSVEQARQASRRVSGKVQASFQDHTLQRSRPPQRHSNPSICSASSSSTQPVRLSASSLHLRLPLVSRSGLCRPITPRSPSRDAKSIDLAAASAAVHTR